MSFPELSSADRENILRHNWWGHDGRWFLFVVKELGFEKANEMNMAVNREVGKVEIKNLMAVSGASRESMTANPLQVLAGNLDLCARDVFVLKELVEEGEEIVLRIESCPAASGTEKAGYMSEYRCACFKRAEGWLEALGIPGRAFIRKSLAEGDPFCEIVLSFR